MSHDILRLIRKMSKLSKNQEENISVVFINNVSFKAGL